MATPVSTYKFGDYYKGNDGKWYRYGGVNGFKEHPGAGNGKPPSGGREVSPPTDTSQRPDLAAASSGTDDDDEPQSAITIGPSTTNLASVTLRWPDANNLSVGSGTDYVLFEFGKFVPPFSNDAVNQNPTDTTNALNLYNASASKFEAEDGSSIILPMPQDLSTEFQNTWQGKSFTSLGKAAVAAIGAGRLDDLKQIGSNDIFSAFKDALTSAGLNNVPGVGGNLNMNDISGSTRGVILNPNAEVLYEAPNLRELGMVFKMVPQSQTEADNILKICQTFRKAAAPSYGVEDTTISGLIGEDKDTNNTLKGVNYIHVPKLCKFTFMTGGGVNKKIAQYKPCAMTRIDVNYTPDGTYATYSDGTPVAITLSLSFMETKIIFANEINLSGASF